MVCDIGGSVMRGRHRPQRQTNEAWCLILSRVSGQAYSVQLLDYKIHIFGSVSSNSKWVHLKKDNFLESWRIFLCIFVYHHTTYILYHHTTSFTSLNWFQSYIINVNGIIIQKLKMHCFRLLFVFSKKILQNKTAKNYTELYYTKLYYIFLYTATALLLEKSVFVIGKISS